MAFPTANLTNQFGETTKNFVRGGSSQLYCNFIVDSANGNGLGIRSLKGQGIKNVFMHTSTTPLGGNPNPAVGYVLIQFSSNYAAYLNGTYGFVSPVSGTPINVTTGVTAGLTYVITSLGTTSASQWAALGVPAVITPALGVAFVAPANATATGTGVIEVPSNTGSTSNHLEIIGDPNTTLNPSDSSGALVLCQLLSATNSSTTTLKPLAPADGTVIGLTFNMVPLPSATV